MPLRVVARAPEAAASPASGAGEETASNNIFVRPGTIAGIFDRARRRGPAAPPQSIVLVSNTGGVEAGAKRTDAVDSVLAAQLGGVAASVNNRKQAVLDRAERSGHSLSRLYTSLGAFAVLAGILLLVNIFFMLADERKSELGMLRAVGLRRGSLIGAFATEGWCYAVVSAIAGTFVGLALGRALMAAAAKLFSAARRRLAHRAPLRVQVGERAARPRRRVRHRDRDGHGRRASG